MSLQPGDVDPSQQNWESGAQGYDPAPYGGVTPQAEAAADTHDEQPTQAPTPPPPDATAAPQAKGRPPEPSDLRSVGVAVLPGVPLPDWVERQELADALIPGPRASQEPSSMGPEFTVDQWSQTPAAVVPIAGGPLPAPNPEHRREQPDGPVVWGLPEQQEPQQPQQLEPSTPPPAASATAYGWLVEGDEQGGAGLLEAQEIPDYAPPPAWPAGEPALSTPARTAAPAAFDSAVPIPPPPEGYSMPATPVSPELPPPPQGFYVPSEQDYALAASMNSAVPIPPPPQGFTWANAS
jgi:hypothetical protein